MKSILFLVYDMRGNMYEWPEVHYYDELVRNGWNVTKLAVPSDAVCDDVVDAVKRHVNNIGRPDLIVSSLDDRTINGSFKQMTDSLSIPSLLICFDNLSVPYKHKASAKYYDLVWLTSKETVDYFVKWGATILFQPYAANPDSFYPQGIESQNRITFLGTPYGARLNRINTLASSGAGLTVYGSIAEQKTPLVGLRTNFLDKALSAAQLVRYPIGRKTLIAALIRSYQGKAVSQMDESVEIIGSVNFNDISRIYHESSLCLSVSELWNTHVLKNPIHKLHLRAFEIPMSGGIQFSYRVPELQEYFEEGIEAVYFDSDEEMIDKSEFYLRADNYSLRQRIKRAARERSVAEHSWMARFQKALNVMGVDS